MKSLQSRINGRWTKEQHQKFLYGLKLYGRNWKKIQHILPTRSSTQIRSHAQKFFIKIKKNQNSEDDINSYQFQINDIESPIKSQILTSNQEIVNQSKKQQLFFFFQNIVKNIVLYQNQGKQFNFWNDLIDQRYNNRDEWMEKTKSCQTIIIQNNYNSNNKLQNVNQKSNNNINTNNNNKQNNKSNFKKMNNNIRYICQNLEQVQSQPCKKIKLF